MLQTNELDKRRGGNTSLQKAIGEEDVRRAFGKSRGTPVLKLLGSGIISPSVTYEMVGGKVPHTREDFYAVNVLSAVGDWLVSGVFWTRQEADSYIHQLKSGKARV